MRKRKKAKWHVKCKIASSASKLFMILRLSFYIEISFAATRRWPQKQLQKDGCTKGRNFKAISYCHFVFHQSIVASLELSGFLRSKGMWQRSCNASCVWVNCGHFYCTEKKKTNRVGPWIWLVKNGEIKKSMDFLSKAERNSKLSDRVSLRFCTPNSFIAR